MNKKVMRLASRGKRLGAYCLDAIIPFFTGIVSIIAAVSLSGGGLSHRIYDFGYDYSYGFGYSYGGSPSRAVASLLICFLFSLAYLIVQLIFFSKSQTIGKAILGLQVVDSRNGEPTGFWKMVLRELFAKKASKAVFLLGYIWVLIDDKNRGWHDKIVETYVIDLNESKKLNRKPAEPKKAEEITTAGEAIVTEFDAEPIIELTEEPAEAPAEAEIEAAVVTEVQAKPAVSLSMKKDELVAIATELGIDVPAKATKADIVELINK